MSEKDALAVQQQANAMPDPLTAAVNLTALWDQESVGDYVVSARVTGHGGDAIAEVRLNSGRFLVFNPISRMNTPKTLRTEIVACTGATPKLNGDQCIESIKLVRALAALEPAEEAVSLDHLAADWGLTFLGNAETVDVDWDDQAARWQAFELLHNNDPKMRLRTEGISIAKASIVLRADDGMRYVRAGWFQLHVQGEDSSASPSHIWNRMLRVGWKRRGKSGRIKATCPGGLRQPHVWPFYVVPADWEATIDE